jgi:hypothetical protein
MDVPGLVENEETVVVSDVLPKIVGFAPYSFLYYSSFYYCCFCCIIFYDVPLAFEYDAQ